MTRKHKSENQKPVSDCSKEAPGSQKRKRDEAIEQENQVLKKQATACFGKWISNTPKNSEVGHEVVSHEVQASNEKIIGDEVQVFAGENTANRAEVQLADDDEFGEEVELQIHTISEDAAENDVCPAKTIEQNDSEEEVDLFNPATWPRLMSSSLKQQIIFSKFEAGPDLGNLTPDTRRYLKGFAFGEKPNGERFQRDWIRVSSTTNSVYCLACCLFGKGKTTPWNNFGANEKGFHDFNHPGRGTSSHESSLAHQESIRIWKINLKEKETGTNLTSAALEKIEKQVSEWRLILRGILDAVLYLAQHNLAFQGNSKDLSALDNGNFLGLVKLLSKYYQPLEKHLDSLEHRKVSYLSPQIQNEFIELCGKTVKSEVLKKIKSRKYYSIMFDSTPDISKHDQLSEVVRSVHCSDRGCYIEESFIDFISCPGKTGAQLSDTILKKLEEDKLDLSDCKGQGYDNGANMAGCYQGVQSHIIRQNPEARFLPCAAYSLNLVGANSVESVRVGKLLLGEIQNLYLFFSGSTSRWEVLLKHSKITLKYQCSTRWSAKAEAVRSVWEHFGKIIDALEEISESDKFSSEVIATATGRISAMLNFKFLLGLCIWNNILLQIDSCNKYLQTKSADLSKAANRLKSLQDWLKLFKEDGFEKCVKESTEVASLHEIPTESGFDTVRRGRGVHYKQIGVSEADTMRKMSNVDRFKVEFFSNIMNTLIQEVEKRFQGLRNAASEFDFLWGRSLESMQISDKEKCVKDLAQKYPSDLNASSFYTEIQTLPLTVKAFLPESTTISNLGPLDVLNIIYMNGLESTYPNSEISLRIFLTLPVSVASNERSFSKLKIIKNYLRSSMGQARLNSLAILSIERELASQIDFDKIITEFSQVKCRKIKFL